ncbi:MAG TPA: DUF488 domain-containing protein [Candidatus Obscuribacterales bacterium]
MTRKVPTIFTIGHSTQSLDELVETLEKNGVTMLVDIRTVPRSRTNPQFNADALAVDLPENGIKYMHMADLGGLRHAKADSPNTVWENASFRGYADYMETGKFRQAVTELLALAQQDQIAIICAEAVWWRCHRGMVSDELVARGVKVEHIIGEKKHPHSLRSFARVQGHHVTYHR